MAGRYLANQGRLLGTAVICGLMGVILLAIPTHATTTDPPRHDVVLLLDDSRSMATYDPTAKRTGFVRFLARYQQVFGDTEDALAVARFAASTASVPTGVTPLVPLTPARQWTHADFLHVQSLECALAGASPSVDTAPCFGTRYAAALTWAAAQLQECAKGGVTNTCDIILFSDGELGKRNSPNPDELVADAPEDVENTLKNLRKNLPNIKIHVVFFSVSDATAPANKGDWQRWQQEKLIQNTFFNASLESSQRVYEAALGFLGLQENLRQVQALALPAENIRLTNDLLPNTARVTLDLLPDGEVNERYAVTPDAFSETRRWWLAPSFNVLTTTLTGQGLVYYRVISQTAPVQALIAIAPPEPKPGQPAEVRVAVGVSGRALTGAHGISLTAVIEPGNFKVTSFTLAPGDLWIAPLPALMPGEYKLRVEARANGKPMGSTAEVGRAEFRVRKATPTVVLRVAPAAQLTGQPFEFEAILFSDDERIVPPAPVSVTVSLSGGDALPLTTSPDRPWLWQAVRGVETPGSYQAVARVQAAGWENVTSTPVMIRVYGSPEIAVSAGAGEVEPGADVTVTLRMPPGESLPPVLLRYGPGGWERVDGMVGLGSGRYEKRLPMSDSGPLVLLAAPPTEAPNLSRPMQTVAAVRVRSQARPVWPVWVPVAIWVFLIVILMALTAIQVRRRSVEKRQMDDLIKIGGPRQWEKIKQMDTAGNWNAIKYLSRYITEGILNGRFKFTD